MTTCTRRFAAAILCVLPFAGLPTPAAYAEVSEEVAALIVELNAATKARDGAAASTAFKKVPAAYTGCDDKAQRSKLLAAVGKALKSKHLVDSGTDAVAALVAIKDPKPAWKILSKAMPNPKKVDEATELHLAVTSAAGALAQARALKPLIELAYKAKDDKLAAAAALSLSGYKNDKKNRVKVLEELMDIGKRTRPGRSTTVAVSQKAKERWQAVGSAVITALNRLTGQEFRSFEEWEEAYKADKKKPKALFVTDDE